MGRVAPRHRIAALAIVLGVVAAPVALGACSSSGGSSGSSNETCPATVDATVHAHDTYRFTPSTLTAKPGKYTVKLVNDGGLDHTFQIHGIDGKATVSAGKTACHTFDLTKGTWTFYCSVAGHESNGMKGTLTVS